MVLHLCANEKVRRPRRPSVWLNKTFKKKKKENQTKNKTDVNGWCFFAEGLLLISFELPSICLSRKQFLNTSPDLSKPCFTFKHHPHFTPPGQTGQHSEKASWVDELENGNIEFISLMQRFETV